MCGGICHTRSEHVVATIAFTPAQAYNVASSNMWIVAKLRMQSKISGQLWEGKIRQVFVHAPVSSFLPQVPLPPKRSPQCNGFPPTLVHARLDTQPSPIPEGRTSFLPPFTVSGRLEMPSKEWRQPRF